MNRLIRISIMSAGLALPLAPATAQHEGHADHAAHMAADPIAAATASPSRTPANVARDPYRHPVETLRFFGVTPQQTVVHRNSGTAAPGPGQPDRAPAQRTLSGPVQSLPGDQARCL